MPSEETITMRYRRISLRINGVKLRHAHWCCQFGLVQWQVYARVFLCLPVPTVSCVCVHRLVKSRWNDGFSPHLGDKLYRAIFAKIWKTDDPVLPRISEACISSRATLTKSVPSLHLLQETRSHIGTYIGVPSLSLFAFDFGSLGLAPYTPSGSLFCVRLYELLGKKKKKKNQQRQLRKTMADIGWHSV